jgi:hypothetical protein
MRSDERDGGGAVEDEDHHGAATIIRLDEDATGGCRHAGAMPFLRHTTGEIATMRVLSHLLFLLAAIIAGFAGLIYLYAAGARCSYALRSSTCSMRWPWELGYEDLLTTVLIPGVLIALLVWGGLALRRMAKRST